MRSKSIEEEWQGYSAMIFSRMKVAPSDTQIAETKKAFFAGAWVMMCAFTEVGEDHVTEEEGCKYVEDRRAECLAFSKRLMQEYGESN